VSVRWGAGNRATATNDQGQFELSVDANAVLAFSYIGYQHQDVPVQGRTTVDVQLKAEMGSLEEVVVVGYGTRKRGNIAAAVSTVSAEQLARTTSTTVSGALVGKSSGITFRQKSGQPGNATQIQIRNLGTPLFVIDGVMKDEGQFNNLDVNDIENISILKDGAAAIYGVKAANGVVLVTTKRGSENEKPTITLNTYYGEQKWFRYPRLLNAYEWNYAN